MLRKQNLKDEAGVLFWLMNLISNVTRVIHGHFFFLRAVTTCTQCILT